MHSARILPVAVFAILAVILVSLSFWYYKVDKEAITREKYATLASISELKSRQIQQWRKERVAEVERAANDILLRTAVGHVLSAPESPEFEKELSASLREEGAEQEDVSSLLFDTGAFILGSSGESVGPGGTATIKAVREVLATGRPAFSDFYRTPGGGINVDIATSVKDAGGRVQAVLVLRHDAATFLYPLIQSWPLPSRSAETLLVQRDGDEVVYLNELRHRASTALSLRYPLTATTIPAVQAVLGKQGIFKGKDYRGVAVVSDLQPVPDSPWFFVAKMDEEEILAEVRFHSTVIGLVGGLLVLLAGGLVMMIYRGRQTASLKKLVWSERRNRDILQAAMDGFCLVDTRGRIQEVNDAYCRITGFSREELLTMSIGDLDVVMSPEAVAAQTQKILSQGWDRFETRHRCKDGTLIALAVSVQFHADDGLLVSFLHDITQQKNRERELELARDAAKSATQAKSEFLAMMSHELRTPLNGILGFTSLLAETSLDADQQGFVQTVHDSGEHLLGVVNDILDFSSIENATLKLESAPIPVSDLVEVAGNMVRKTAANKGLEYRCEMAPGMPEHLLGDQRRILQILINLLGNAVKFTSEGSVILRVSPASDAGRPVLDFSIEDTGPGILPGTIAQLFQPFVQEDSSLRRRFEGTGLGLAISQRLAQAMGGNVTVSSAPGMGSTFTLRLPADGDADPEAKTPNPQPPNLPPPGGLVLVAEDDRVNGMLAEKILISLGMRVEIARTGRAAVEAFVPGKYAAIFMDVQMPEMNGIEATLMIREIEAGTGSRVPIIALTANVMPADREQCLNAGMDAFLSKPFRKDEMSAKLARCLSAM